MKLDLFMRQHYTGFIRRNKQQERGRGGCRQMDEEMRRQKERVSKSVHFQTLPKLDIYSEC